MWFLKKEGTVGFCESKIEKFRDQIKDSSLALIFDIILETGCSSYEIVNIKKTHYKGEKLILVGTPKKRSKHRASISKELSKTIEFHIKSSSDQYLFSSVRGGQLSKRRIEQLFADHSKKVGIKITPKLLSKIKQNEESLSLISKTENICKKNISSERDFIILSIVNETGCKTSELSSLKCKDIDNCKINLSNPKRVISISKELSKSIISYSNKKRGDKYLFSVNGDSPISNRRIQQVFSEYSKNTSTKITPSLLRRQAIQRMAVNGSSISKIKKEMGLGTVNKFTHGFSGVDELRR